MLRFRNRAEENKTSTAQWQTLTLDRFARRHSNSATGSSPSNDELAVRWWEWVAQSHLFDNPVQDETGTCGHLNQSEDVWFLANSHGGEVNRACEVPASTPLFAPILNSLSNDDEDSFSFMANADVEATLDGIVLEVITVVNACGKIHSNVPNPITKFPGVLGISASGYFIRLVGLTPGTHRIVLRGSFPGFGLDLSYDITAV